MIVYRYELYHLSFDGNHILVNTFEHCKEASKECDKLSTMFPNYKFIIKLGKYELTKID